MYNNFLISFFEPNTSNHDFAAYADKTVVIEGWSRWSAYEGQILHDILVSGLLVDTTFSNIVITDTAAE